jgi:hypothetical protein
LRGIAFNIASSSCGEVAHEAGIGAFMPLPALRSDRREARRRTAEARAQSQAASASASAACRQGDDAAVDPEAVEIQSGAEAAASAFR